MKRLVAMALLGLALGVPGFGRAALPGANGLIAFNWIDTGNYDVYVIDPGGGDPTNLTSHPAEDVNPAWSPDGETLAFVSNRSGPYAVHTMNADGSGVAQISFPATGDGWPTWSPAGDRIAFVRSTSSDGTGIFIMNADGSGVVQVTSGFTDLTPAWSPDGMEIAFSRFLPSGGAAIFAVHPDGTGLRQITTPAGATDQGPNWFPDGTRLLFSRFAASSAFLGIYEVLRDGSGETQLVDGEASEMAVYSPDGTRLAFVGPQGIFVADADGTDPMHLVAGQKPDWQPSGATCAGGGLSGPTLLNSDANEDGPLSSPVHTEVEPLVGSAVPVRVVVHEINCDVVITVEGLSGVG